MQPGPDRRNEIVERVRALERAHAVRVLFAIESGSRAWGFASPDSDFDVRFVYVHGAEWYLSVRDRRDVIEEPIDGDLDVNGWELRKALRLMVRSNPVLFEWLDSPIVYVENALERARFRALAGSFFRPIACWHHYHSTAKTNYRSYLQGERVRLKKYFYVLRPLLACRWIEAGRGPAPMLFDALVDATVEDATLRQAIDELLEVKRTTAEIGEAPRVEVLNAFIERELVRHQSVRDVLPASRPPDLGPVDEFFRACVTAV